MSTFLTCKYTKYFYFKSITNYIYLLLIHQSSTLYDLYNLKISLIKKLKNYEKTFWT